MEMQALKYPERRSLADQAYDRVERMIVTLELAPGSVFSEAELSNHIGIGRTPLREALQRLAGAGLVVSLPRRGMMVTDVNIVEYLALLETRRVLDRLVCERAAARATDEQREALNACARELKAAADADLLDEFIRLDGLCDSILGGAARNPFAVRAVEPLHAHCRRFWSIYRHNGDLRVSADLHTAIMVAVADANGAEAGEAAETLIDYLVRFTREALEVA